jgi:hypothetical protein
LPHGFSSLRQRFFFLLVLALFRFGVPLWGEREHDRRHPTRGQTKAAPRPDIESWSVHG